MRLATQAILSALWISAEAVGLAACAHLAPDLHGKLWQGDPSRARVERAQDGSALSCGDPSFRAYTCEKTLDLDALLKACREWYP